MHLVLLDMNMPTLTGLETLQLVRQVNAVIPCILVTDVPRREADVFQHSEVRKKMEPLKDHADPRPQRDQLGRVRGRVRLQLQAGDLDRAGVERVQSIETAQERALPAARRPDQGDGLTFVYLDVDAAQHLAGSVRFVQIAHAQDHAVTACTTGSSASASRASSRAATRASG